MAQLDEPDSEHKAALSCNDCGEQYWTDPYQSNDCPECGSYDFDVHGPEGH